MKTAKLSDLIGIINKIAPQTLAESWDNSGMQLGDPGSTVQKIMVALEPTLQVINSAISSSCQLLLTHHPLIFKPNSSITTSTPTGKAIHTAIKASLAVFSMHTNYDSAAGGLNDLLAEYAGLSSATPLKPGFRQELVKLVLFVPESHLESVRAALFPFTLSLGEYSDCSFSTVGEGTFKPGNLAHPFIGTVGALEKVAEQRLELLIDKTVLPKAINRLLSVHPYEEPAYDIYPLLNNGLMLGLGRMGHLATPLTLKEYAQQIANSLKTRTIRYVGNPDAMIRKVAVCSGSGASLMGDAIRAGADLLLTGDVKYHDARDAEAHGIALIDAGHFGTEIIMAEAVQKRLQKSLRDAGYADCHVITCTEESDPFKLINIADQNTKIGGENGKKTS